MTIPTTFVPKETQPRLGGALFESEPRRVGTGSGVTTGESGGDCVTSPRNHGLILYGRLFASIGKSQSQTLGALISGDWCSRSEAGRRTYGGALFARC
jgi:hypothetical protein